MNKILRISPPDGEFTVMNYRVNGDFSVPFRIFPFVDES
jgi:AP-4 complex subunit mu-1